MTHAHEVNVLGALATEVARRVQEVGEAASPYGASVPAALTALHGLTGRVLARREAAIETVLAPLTARERVDLARLHERLLASLMDGRQDRRRVCRLCDVDACGGDCPTRVELQPSAFS